MEGRSIFRDKERSAVGNSSFKILDILKLLNKKNIKHSKRHDLPLDSSEAVPQTPWPRLGVESREVPLAEALRVQNRVQRV